MSNAIYRTRFSYEDHKSYNVHKKVSVHRIICPNYVMDIFRVYTDTCQIKLYNVHVSLTCEDLDALQQNWNPQIHFIYF